MAGSAGGLSGRTRGGVYSLFIFVRDGAAIIPMAPLLMSQTSFLTPVTRGFAFRTPIRLVQVVSALLILVLLAFYLTMLLRLREDAIVGVERDLSAIALTLAEQADRAVQGADLVLDDIGRYGVSQGIVDSNSFDRIMSSRATHEILRERMIGLPQINTLLIFGIDGNLKNDTRGWPVQVQALTSRNFLSALLTDPAKNLLITPPFKRRSDGVWTVLLVHKIRGADGQGAGLVGAALQLSYFEDFYRSVSVGEDRSISLLRSDGMQLARYPPAGMIGQNFISAQRMLETANSGTMRGPSPFDGTLRVKAARRLKIYPLTVLVTIDQGAALAGWRNVAWVLSVGTGGSCLAIIIGAVAIGRRWHHREALSHERESRALTEAALMRERERNAENENRAKSGFLAMMSHEIRTPMNGVLGLTGTLLDTPLTNLQRQIVDSIRESGDSLMRILNDILDFSKLESGRIEFEETPFPLATLTQNPVSLLGPRAIAKGLSISAMCEEGLPEALLGDAGRLRQVLINLVSNAVKFTERGTVTIRVACPERDEQFATIVWSVIDTGIGIPQDRIGGLFAEFIQADATIARRFGGSGLGLAISKRLIEQMGGTIGVESFPGRGSTFTVTLRLRITEAATEETTTPVDVVGAFERRLGELGRSARLLFAEDNPTNQFVALQMLRGLDLQTDVVADGLEAVHAASSFLYDLICMDVRMPEMDGLAATRAIRAMGGRLSTIPIIALTANAFPEDVAACFDAGMTAFVAKPVRKETLVAALLSALDTAAPATANIESGFASNQALDHEAFGSLTEEIGADGVVPLVTMFESETRARLLVIANRALGHDWLLREVHSLKGAASAVCATSLSQRAAALETLLRRNDMLTGVEVGPLSEAFNDWLTAVNTAGLAEAAA